MRRYSENSENRYYGYLPNSTTRNSSSNSSNRNTHYQYYDPRLRTQQQAQQTLYEYQYSYGSPGRSPSFTYGSSYNPRHHYQPPSFPQDLPPSSANSISDLGEPISIFHDIKPLEHRRSIASSSLPALTYIPPDPTRRPSASDVRLATAQVLREQLLSDIEHTITDIDRELTSLERRPSGPRYVPPRFSPIVELDAHDDPLFGELTTTTTPNQVHRLPRQKPIPMIGSPVQKQTQRQPSVHSAARDRNSGASNLNWPNKPKRVYEVIPSLNSDSRKTSRQSSVNVQKENTKISEPQSPLTPTRSIGKHTSISSIQFRGQYHYAPEVEEIEIIPTDPENSEHKSTYSELREASFHEPLNVNDFIRNASATPQSRALILLPEFGDNSQIEPQEQTDDLFENNQHDADIARLLSAGSLHELVSTRDLLIENLESLIQTAPEEIKLDSHVTQPIPSPKTMTPDDLYNTTETDIRDQHRPASTNLSSTITAITGNISPEKEPYETSPSPLPLPPSSPSPSKPISAALVPHSDGKVSGLVAYFFSDFGNEGEGEEDTITIDQNNFVIPTGAEIIADDDLSGSLMGQSQASLLILHSAHVPRRQSQQQQQLTSIIPLSIEGNNERVNAEEKEEIGSIETDATTKRLSTTTSHLPSSSSPSSKQVFPTSIIDDMQTQFSRNNSAGNVDHHRRTSTASPLNMKIVDLNREEHERDLNHSPAGRRTASSTTSKAPEIRSRTQTNVFDVDDNEIEQINQEIMSKSRANSRLTPVENLDNERIQISPTERIKSSSTSTSNILPHRSVSTASKHTNNDEKLEQIDSPTRTLLKNDERENSSRRSSYTRQQAQSPSMFAYDQPTTPIDDDFHRTPTNDNEPNAFTVQSDHFLHDQSPSTPNHFNPPLSPSYSVPRESESRRSSLDSSTIPVALNSPDNDQAQPTGSRPPSPQRKLSVASIDPPLDPTELLTTTDEPDPNDPTITNSTIHFQMLAAERDEPSPLVNIAPIQTFPVPTEPELPVETHDKSRVVSPENEIRLPSAASSKQDENPPSHRTPSTSKSQQRLSPLLSYPARLEDLMRPTPSPFHSGNEDKEQQNDNDDQHDGKISQLNGHFSPVEQVERRQSSSSQQQNPPKRQLIPSPSDHNDNHSPSISPRSEASNGDHTSVEGDDNYRLQLKTPPLSPDNDQVLSPDHVDRFIDDNNNDIIRETNIDTEIPPVEKQQTLKPPVEPTFITEKHRRLSSQKSSSSINSSTHQQDGAVENLHRNDAQLTSGSLKPAQHNLSPPQTSSSPPPQHSERPISNEEVLPTITPSQQHSKLSLRVKKPEPKPKESSANKSKSSRHPIILSPLPHNDRNTVRSVSNDENSSETKSKQQKSRRRRVSFSSSVTHFQFEERQLYANWRERVAAILASKHRPNEKYAHVKSRVDSFANFEHQPKKIKTVPKKKSRPKVTEENKLEESKFLKRKRFKVKRPHVRSETDGEYPTDDDPHSTFSRKGLTPQIFGRLWCLPDGNPTVFHEPLEWNAQSTLGSYSFENLHYEPHRSDFKIFNEKLKWNSESKLSELLKGSPRFPQHQVLLAATSMPTIPDQIEPFLYQQQFYQQPSIERKIFDIQSNNQHQTGKPMQTDTMSHGSRPSDVIPIFQERLQWTGKSKIKDMTWQNIGYQPKKSRVQIVNKNVHWHSEPKVRTRSPATIHPSRASMSNVQIFDQKLNWDAQAKVHCWSEIDLRQLTKKKSIFAQYHDPKWNDIVTARIDATNYRYPRLQNQVQIFSDRPTWTRNSELKDYVWENFDYKTQRRIHQSNKQKHLSESDQESDNMAFDLRLSTMFLSQFRRANTPPNRPKWNAVSKTKSVNSVYNPTLNNANQIRRGWDRDLRRKRVQKLPPLKRKREHEEMPHLAIDASTTNGQLAIDYPSDHVSTMNEHMNSSGYPNTSSRRSSRALVPINHDRRLFELELPTETPRSQRPIQQEWYEEMNKSRLTHRTDMGRATNHSFRNSFDSNHQANTPRELVTFRSSTRNSQNSVVSGALLDSTVRTNRTTEFRLSKDMDEHHHHSHTPSQSMPIEIRGFQLEGTQLSVPDHATIRPLSNVSYGSSERVKNRRVYPWSSLHPHGTSSRNSSLVPIAEFRRSSLDTTINESQQPFIKEE